MKAGTSKQKGNQFENKIAKDLSLWLTNGKREDVLIRSQNSGGRATMLSYSGRNFMSQAGDISAVESDGLFLTEKFILECKHYADLLLPSLFFRTAKGGVLEHWNKLLKECNTYNKLPLYIARQNGKPILIGMDQRGVELLKLHNHIEIHIRYMDLHLMPLKTFLEVASPSTLKPPIIIKPRTVTIAGIVNQSKTV